ncbi:AraC family transcriptional regulator [Methylomonas montana]|uniref:AraC family transcriptional regulator n=1 Tax=Methylomonas montana TaxID=3058963 RepID=UPI002659BF43|nr:AraC family transcriptional regulator [Methylomonas montana]WKJ89249.1 AraC family transcriptional regulator [Methylomonas montana]
MNPVTDQLAHWLLASLELDTTLFHIGQYCGTWRAAPSDVMRSGFHLVLNGQCWLHLPEKAEALALQKGDAVFFIRETTHYLSPTASPDDPALCRVKSGEMLPIDENVPDSVALACGFFDFKSGLSAMLLSSFPDYLIIRGSQTELLAAKTIFDLILTEARQSGETASPLIVRLTDVLFFYAIRQLATTQEISAGLWAVVQSPEFAKLVEAVINEPEKDWPVEKMADYSHMSRATFFKRFSQVAGQTPNLFLVMVRMKMAAQLLRQGRTISQVAEKVGYQSESAFSKAFKKVIGQQPGAYQKKSHYFNKVQTN